ncbi:MULTISPECIES: hypothetical protein [Clostridium]|jgi:multimeric flavodoxin WrbA|uniref:Multimeric flavodoxin WrbA family protein,diverged or disrupted n=1 Tax=Clostridium disporicum TaxID=84024 RepID=A0A174ILA7_9CLOT|nr:MULTISPECIES: hypothetical protein [Clostridium]MBX9184711.1 hypothetical protein [Clostridium sp. K04]MDU7453437.1 hypothetical protein [Clostridium saudiense]MEE0727360.1 hypothetical protein [Clostridium saudiense]CUO45227.1 multimeric flavodoxin WrbA family protein%2Cdiverged or disrupted [Clostridium disporicum]CUO86317.1 multimeric flavodoxin WrbA family protein%2Cdiverged or disrupted [Clostridium disporicum]
MKIMMIDGSPKVSKSNSEYFLNILSDFIESKDIVKYKLSKKVDYEDIIKEINTIDTLVFAFPLYVDSLPSHVLEFLIMLEENFKDNLKGVNVYVIANCGFYEGKQNKIALNIMKCWCKKMNIKWAQGIGIGAGEMMGGLRNVPMGKGPNTNLGLALDNLAKNINENKSGDDIFTTPSMFPRFAFRLAANRFWISKANRNGLKKRDLNKCIVKQ